MVWPCITRLAAFVTVNVCRFVVKRMSVASCSSYFEMKLTPPVQEIVKLFPLCTTGGTLMVGFARMQVTVMLIAPLFDEPHEFIIWIQNVLRPTVRLTVGGSVGVVAPVSGCDVSPGCPWYHCIDVAPLIVSVTSGLWPMLRLMFCGGLEIDGSGQTPLMLIVAASLWTEPHALETFTQKVVGCVSAGVVKFCDVPFG